MGMMIRRNKMRNEAVAAEKQAASAKKDKDLQSDVPDVRKTDYEEPKRRGRRPKFED